MANLVTRIFSKFLGNKSERDLKEVTPYAEAVKKVYDNIATLSNDGLRNKSAEFKVRIAKHIEAETAEIAALRGKVETDPEMGIEEKETLFVEIDRLEKEKYTKIQEVLNDILPEAFAVVKETAKRFKENEKVEVTATDFDRDLSVKKANVEIIGSNAYWHNSWLAAGNKVTWDMVHYDVQLIGGTVLHQGKISEMATGEGKTLVATLPMYLNALPGLGVHVVTVNDYLAKRDSEWMAPLFEFHGLRVDCIDKHDPNTDERRAAYNADITYGTNNEFGFDYLRDNMARGIDELVQRKHNYAIVDEVDSVLIDDARTPLIISGPTPKGDKQEFNDLKPKIERLVNAQKTYLNTTLADAKKLLAEGKEKEAGLALLRAHRGLPKNKALIKFLSEPGVKVLLQKTENFYMQDQNREMPQVDKELFFVIEEKNNSVDLTEKGVELITETAAEPDFFIMPDFGATMAEIEKSTASPEERLIKKDELMRDFAIKSERIHTINQLLKAYSLFEKDVEYVVMDGKIKIVDEQTGRILDGRRYSDGLHQAIEAKENVKIEAATQTYATVTLQNYFRMYGKLAGMTGTAETEAGELWDIYKLDVVVIPTNRPITRKDEQDMVFKTKREKYNAVIDEVETCVKAGRPVLVGTTSVENSELLSRMLKLRGIKHNVLNAKQHQREADIVAEAGQAGTVTIATNMAGRGTDIKLGPGVKDAGGLAIVGTERHESRRVDRQLRGRAGRQGDPGSSQFFVSFEDDLMRMFGSERIAKLMDRMGFKEGEVIQAPMLTNTIEKAQKKVEENNFGTRKRLLEYDDVMNSQREVIYTKRRNALFGDRLALDLNNMIYDVCESLVKEYLDGRDYETFSLEVIRHFSVEVPIDENAFLKQRAEETTEQLFANVIEAYHRKTAHTAQTAYPVISDVYKQSGQQFENIAIPLSDGIKTMQVVANLKKSYESQGRELIHIFERSITLTMIDEAWKEHLREMDDLKQSVQNAVYEQKDPLLIYKFESFELFQKMLDRVNKDIVSFLFKASLPNNEAPLREARQQAPQPKLKTSREDVLSGGDGQQNPNQQVADTREVVKTAPVRVEQKVGRNDPCPCGSGKKYKACHGKDEV